MSAQSTSAQSSSAQVPLDVAALAGHLTGHDLLAAHDPAALLTRLGLTLHTWTPLTPAATTWVTAATTPDGTWHALHLAHGATPALHGQQPDETLPTPHNGTARPRPLVDSCVPALWATAPTARFDLLHHTFTHPLVPPAASRTELTQALFASPTPGTRDDHETDDDDASGPHRPHHQFWPTGTLLAALLNDDPDAPAHRTLAAFNHPDTLATLDAHTRFHTHHNDPAARDNIVTVIRTAAARLWPDPVRNPHDWFPGHRMIWDLQFRDRADWTWAARRLLTTEAPDPTTHTHAMLRKLWTQAHPDRSFRDLDLNATSTP